MTKQVWQNIKVRVQKCIACEDKHLDEKIFKGDA